MLVVQLKIDLAVSLYISKGNIYIYLHLSIFISIYLSIYIYIYL